MSFKLALSAGHGYHTPGKRCDINIDKNQTREWWLNDRIADKIQSLLSEYENIDILRLDDTTGQVDIVLKDRTAKANNWKANLYLSIHHNAGINGGTGGGITAYIYNGNVPQSTIDWQQSFYNELVNLTGLKGNRSNGCPRSNLHECRESSMDAVLLELGFMDSTTDVPIILTEDFANKCAQACAYVIVSKAGLIKKQLQQLYRVRTTWTDSKSQRGAYTSLDSAKKCCQDAGVGYNVFDNLGNIVYSYIKTEVDPIENQDTNLSESLNKIIRLLENLLNVISKIFTK